MRQRETKGQSLCLICIGAGETRAAHLLTDAFVEMHRVHPGVAIELFTGNADTVEERLERGLLDFALVIEPVNVDKYKWLRMPESDHSGVAVGAGSEWARLDARGPCADAPARELAHEQGHRFDAKWHKRESPPSY